ncbi:hypothetical protein BDY19DRAFT_609389 [Irpex rosettiformis]|uniref:Uncharacterized protein n=1 Tax=Irpex rosettiformis TaxID=378272 RepID=A0ACB8TPI0_9APHY|nr:hypothetical protein BDY19DRAFT_609389 [Irpex rosettiformis]
MPVTFRPAAHAANSIRDLGEVTSLNLLRSSCEDQQEACDELLQSFIGSGPNATGGSLLTANTGLVSTVLSAYNQHYALILRPDDVWLTILIQFSFYVNAHAEELRESFVAHEGKKEVTVQAIGTRYTVNFGALAEQMTKAMDSFIVDRALKDWILTQFSTTTSNDTVVAAVLMMATLKEYFSYGFELCCGIPRVTLEGEKSDWEEILRRAEKLKDYGKETAAWYKLLQPVLSRFVSAFDAPQAEENIDFWQRVAHEHRQFSGPSYISGWITAFCAFSAKGKWLGLPLDEEANVVATRRQEVLTLDGAQYHVVTMKYIPLGHASVDVLLNDNGEEFKTVMVAGLVATRVSDSEDTSLSEHGTRDSISPAPGWWIFTKRGDDSKQ